jgi:hypothetical protein
LCPVLPERLFTDKFRYTQKPSGRKPVSAFALMTKVTRESLDDRDGRRAMEIISFSIILEHIGDIIDKNLMEIAVKKIKPKYEFSKEGARELAAFHKRIIDNPNRLRDNEPSVIAGRTGTPASGAPQFPTQSS